MPTVISRHPVSSRGQPPGWFILHAASTVSGSAVATGDGFEEGEALEAYGVTRASLSGRARTPVRFTFHVTAP